MRGMKVKEVRKMRRGGLGEVRCVCESKMMGGELGEVRKSE